MRPDLVILFEPLIDDGLRLAGCAKPFGVQNFEAKFSFEALLIPVRPQIAPLERFLHGLTPRRSWIDADRFDTTLISKSLKGSDENSGPLSARRYSGFPRLRRSG